MGQEYQASSVIMLNALPIVAWPVERKLHVLGGCYIHVLELCRIGIVFSVKERLMEC